MPSRIKTAKALICFVFLLSILLPYDTKAEILQSI